MISRCDSVDGNRAIIVISPDEEISVIVDENDFSLIGGKRENLEALYYALKDFLEIDNGEDE